MSNRRNALGRGIGALIPTAPAPNIAEAQPRTDGRAAEIPIDAIDANPEQPRRRFEAAELEGLSDSIRRHGVLQPVIVRRSGNRYELVVGEPWVEPRPRNELWQLGATPSSTHLAHTGS